MAGGGEAFLIRIKTQFESAGIQQIAAQARQALSQLSQVPAPQRVAAVQEVRNYAESRIGNLQSESLRGIDRSNPKYSSIMDGFDKARRALNTTFDQMARSAGDLSKIDLSGLPEEIRNQFRQAVAEFNKLAPGVRREVQEAISKANYSLTRNLGSAALHEVAPQARASLARLGEVPAKDRVQTAKDIRTQAERRILELRDRKVAGLDPNDANYSTVMSEFSRARRSLTSAFKDMAEGGVDLARVDMKSMPKQVQRELTEAVAEFNKLSPAVQKRIRDAIAQANREISILDLRRGLGQPAGAGGGSGGGGGRPPPTRLPDGPDDDDDSPGARAAAISAATSKEAATQRILAKDKEYLDAQALLTRIKTQQAAKIQATLADDDKYIKAEARVARAKEQQAAKIQSTLANDDKYIKAQVGVTRAKALQEQRVQAALGSDDAYIKAQIGVARAKAVQQQRVQAGLASDTAYVTAQAGVARAKAIQSQKIESTLAGDSAYVAAQAGATRAKALQSARIEATLAGDSAYIAAQAIATTAKAQQAQRIEQTLAGDAAYTAAQAGVTRAKAIQAANIQQTLASDSAYIAAQASVARSKSIQAARTQEALAGDGAYLQAQVAVTRAKALQTARTQESLAGDSTYIQAQVAVARAKAIQAAVTQQSLAGDTAYIAAQVASTRAKAVQAAQTQQSLAGDSAYIAAQVNVTRAKAVQAARTEQSLAGDSAYIAAQVSVARSKAIQAAQTQQSLAGDSAYIAAQVSAARAKAIQAAKTQESLSGDSAYIAAQASAARSKAIQTAKTQEILAGDSAYIAAQVSAARAKAIQGARTQESLAGDSAYIQAQVAATRAKAIQAQRTQEALAGDGVYASAQARAAQAKALQGARTEALLAADNIYAAAQARATRSKAIQSAKTQESLSTDDLYTSAQARAAAAKALQAAKTEELLADDSLYAAAQARAARAKAQQAAETQRLLGADGLYIAAQVNTARDKAVQDAKVKEGVAADDQYIQAEADAARGKALEAQKTQELLSADEAYINATARAAIARRSIGIQTKAAEHGIPTKGRSDQDLEVETAIRERIRADRLAAATARARADRETVQGRQMAAAEAERRVALRELAAIEHREARQEIQQQIRAGVGTRAQRLQASFAAPTANKSVTDYQTIGQAIGSRALTTVGFGIAGSALYGAVRVVGDMVRESEELERVLNQVDAQLTAIGPNSAQSFGTAKKGILDIARATGAQADETAAVFFQFRGVFAGMTDATGLADTTEALRQTEQAMKVTAVTGLSLKEVIDSLTAVSKIFGSDIDDISDQALGLQERFGVLAKETITFTADLAPVAKDAGLSLADTAALGAVAQQVSGKSGSALAEAFGRVIPQISEVKDEILSLYNLPQLQGKSRTQVLEGFATGNTGDVLKRLIADYNSLSTTQQKSLVNTLGGRRETQALVGVFQEASKLTAEWDKNLKGLNTDSGKTDTYFQKLTKTIQNTQARFAEIGKQIGEALFSSGLAESFAEVVNIAGVFVGMIATVARVVGGLNHALGGIPIKLLVVAGILRLLQPLWSRLAVAMRIKTAATVQDTSANIVNARSLTGVSGATTVSTASTSGAAAARRGAASVGAAETALGDQIGAAAGFGRVGAGADKALSGAAKLGGVLARALPVFLAFELLNQFMQNSANQAEQVRVTADKARSALEGAKQGQGVGGETPDQALARLRREAAEAKRKFQAVDDEGGLNGALGIAGNNIGDSEGISRFFDFANSLPVIGYRGEARGYAARAAGGQDQDYVVLEKQIAAFEAQKLEGIIGPLLTEHEAATLDAVRSGSLKSLQEIFDRDKNLNTKDVKKFFGGDGKIDAEDITADSIRALIEAAKGGDRKATALLDAMSRVTDNPALLKLLNDAKVKAEETAAGGAGELALQKLEETKKTFEAGALSVGRYIDIAKEKRAGIQEQIDTARRLNKPVDPNLFTSLALLDKQIGEAIVGYMENQRQTLTMFSEVRGVGSPADKLFTGTRKVDNQTVQGNVQGVLLARRIARATAAVDSDAGGTFDQKFAQVGPLIALLQEQFARDLEQIVDPVEKARRAAQGFAIPEAARKLLVEKQLRDNPALSKMVEDFTNLSGQTLDQGFVSMATDIVTATGDARASLLAQVEAEIRKIEETIGTVDESAGDLERLRNLRGLRGRINATSEGVEVPGDTGYEPEQAENARIQAERQKALTKAQNVAARVAADTRGDPVAVAEANVVAAQEAIRLAGDDEDARYAAETQYYEAVNARTNATHDVAVAELQLLQQQNSRDSVRSAEIGLELAYKTAENAVGVAAQKQAEIAILQAEEALRAAREDVLAARGEAAIQRAGRDPVAVANATLAEARRVRAQEVDPAKQIRADTAIREAEEQLQLANEDIVMARFEAAAAQVARDPVRSARVGLQQAQFARSIAQGAAAQIRADTAIRDAQNALRLAMEDVALAQLEQVQAYADAAGRTVESAAIQLQIAQQKLKDILADPASGSAERIRAETDVIRAQAGARDARFQDQLGTIEFMQTMEQIGVQQAIAMLEAMLQIPDLTRDQIRDLQTRIKALKDEAKADFQFNIPGEINLPTLYEVRRLNQTPSGSGYNDNRTIQISFVANNNVDAQAVANTIVDGFSRPTRFGTAPRMY